MPTQTEIGQMKWLPVGLVQGHKILHLRRKPFEPWLPFHSFPLLIPENTRSMDNHGFAVAHYLVCEGWNYAD